MTLKICIIVVLNTRTFSGQWVEEKSKKMRYYRILKELRPSEYKIGQEINVNEIGFQLFFFKQRKLWQMRGKDEKVSSHFLCVSLLNLGIGRIFQFYTDFLMAFGNYLFALHKNKYHNKSFCLLWFKVK